MNSKQMCNDELFMRSAFTGSGRYQFPIIKKQTINLDNIELLAYSSSKSKDSKINKQKGIHFFLDDYRFNSVYKNPARSLKKLSQYAFVITPDYSTYAKMPVWRQIESIGHMQQGIQFRINIRQILHLNQAVNGRV